MTPDQGFMTVRVREGESIDLMGASMHVVVRMGDGDEDTVLIRSTMGAQPRQVPLHAHADIESFYVLTGTLDVFLNDATPAWRTLRAGQSVTVPPNVRHAVRNVSGAPVDSILVTTVRIARFFGEIGSPPGHTPLGPPTVADIARICSVAERYGYWMGSAADNTMLPA